MRKTIRCLRCVPRVSPAGFRRLLPSAVALALVFSLPAAATSSEPLQWQPDEGVQAGIVACDAAASDDGLVSALCRNRNQLVQVIGLCEADDASNGPSGEQTLRRWDQRNADLLRRVGEVAAGLAADAADPETAPLWTPAPDAPSIAGLMSETMADSYQRFSTDDRRKFCTEFLQGVDAGEMDEPAPPPER
jgi:hypothetical protein